MHPTPTARKLYSKAATLVVHTTTQIATLLMTMTLALTMSTTAPNASLILSRPRNTPNIFIGANRYGPQDSSTMTTTDRLEDAPSTTICDHGGVSTQNQPSDDNDNKLDNDNDGRDREIPTLTHGHAAE